MKKLIALLLFVCLLPLCALAEMDEDGNVVVALDGAEVSFASLEGVYLLTRDSSASEFNRLGLSQREIVPSMEKEDLYALFFDMELEVEIQICIKPTADSDYDDLTAEQLAQACEEIRSMYTSWGWQVETAEPYLAPGGHQYVKSVYSYTFEDGSTTCSAEYYTRQAGYALGILIYPFGDEVTAAQLAQGAAIADSLRMKEVALEGRWEEAAIESVSVRFRLPEDVKYLTKDSSAEDWSGLPKSYVALRKKELAWNDYQGLIMSPDAKWEIRWTLYELDDGSDLDDCSDEDAEALLKEYVDLYYGVDCNISYSDCVWIGSHRYVNVRYNYPTGGSLNHFVEYYTLQSGKGILVTLVGYGETAPEEAKMLLQDILESQIIRADQ